MQRQILRRAKLQSPLGMNRAIKTQMITFRVMERVLLRQKRSFPGLKGYIYTEKHHHQEIPTAVSLRALVN